MSYQLLHPGCCVDVVVAVVVDVVVDGLMRCKLVTVSPALPATLTLSHTAGLRPQHINHHLNINHQPSTIPINHQHQP